jgi:3-hydroxyisobutyrate dehydrogenase-like beta-hydroxyacid dehydrogenase
MSLPGRPVVGVLHPGAMGAALGAALKPVAGQVIWAAAGRSDRTAKRAELADLVAVPDVARLVARSDVVVSVCPPDAALSLARQAAASATPDRPAIYVDANAVAPETVTAIAALFGPDRVVDGAVIGGPAWHAGDTMLWLAGAQAGAVAALFDGSPFRSRTLPGALGTASALKACFALQSKALPALWATLAAAADRYGVAAEIRAELARDGVDLDRELGTFERRASGKAWRWSGEMDEAAATFAAVGLPAGFSAAAAETYRRRSAEPDDPEGSRPGL